MRRLVPGTGPSHAILLLLFLQGIACHPYMNHCERWDYEDLMAVCGYDSDDPDSGYLMGRLEYSVDLGCVEAISQHYCVDWRSFDEEPAPFNYPDSVGKNLIASLLTIAGTTAGPLSPEQLDLAPAKMQQFASDMPNGVGLGEVMFEFTTQGIETIRYEDNDRSYMAAHKDGLVKLHGESISWTDGPSIGGDGSKTNVGLISLILVHEASHRIYGDHIGCDLDPEPVSCDPDIEGAYGLSTWWSMTWMKATLDRIYGTACSRMLGKTEHYGCGRIGDHGVWPYCDEEAIEPYIDCDEAWWDEGD
jgi:hypothetical protein